MIQFEYLCPTSVGDACRLLSELGDKARVIAGGTDLCVQLREQNKRFSGLAYIIDLTGIRGMDFIIEDGSMIRIGAMATHDLICKSPLLQEAVPFLCQAASTVGSLQIRNRATIGGNIGNASPAADTVPPLVVLDATVRVESIRGARTVPLVSIFSRPNRTNLAADEIITEIMFQRPDPAAKTAFIKLGRRKAIAISRMNAAAVVKTDADGRITEAKITAGCILPVPGRIKAAEEAIIGRMPADEVFQAAGAAVAEEMIRITGIRWSTEYKKPVVEALIRRVLKQALGVD